MKILCVNPNTTQAVTDIVLAEARRHVAHGSQVTGVTAGSGVAIVTTEAENVVAARAALDLVSAHHAGQDAIVMAISFDTAVAEARALTPIPVVGITEAALHTACLLGRKFGLVVMGAVSLPLYESLIGRSGLGQRLAAIEIAELGSVAGYLDAALRERLAREAAQRLARRPGVDVIVLCGAAVAGLAAKLRGALSQPCLDGVGPAIRQAELLVGLATAPAQNRAP